MLSVLEPIFLLLIFIAPHQLNAFGETMPEDPSASKILEAVNKLQNEIELMKKENENTRIYKVIAEPQNASVANFLADGRSQTKKTSQNYDEHFNCIKNCTTNDESCPQVTKRNKKRDGVYLLKPKSVSKPFYAYCRHDFYSEAWTVIQRRQDGSVNFNRTWLDYKLGFGDLNGDYWIGLERIHQITKSIPHDLEVWLYDAEGRPEIATYLEFSVGSEDSGYKLTVGEGHGFNPGDFMEHNSMRFSTFDKHNFDGDDCDQTRIGGWWYRVCYETNLNGPYYFHNNAKKDHEKGIHDFISWKGMKPVFDEFMAIRPRCCSRDGSCYAPDAVNEC